MLIFVTTMKCKSYYKTERLTKMITLIPLLDQNNRIDYNSILSSK